MEHARGLLLDIEGTTTPISFVHETLFGFAREHVAGFLRNHRDDPGVLADVQGLAEEAERDRAEHEGVPVFSAEDPASAVPYVHWLMDRDRKLTALKSLQGKIWRSGYEDGTLRGAVFDDVPDVIRRTSESGVPVCIYSSGSVEAQRLLFANTTAGDLTPHIDRYFDTTTGSKKEAQSYRKIAAELDLAPGQILFATDSLDEAHAADEAGVSAVILERPGNDDLPEHGFEVWTTLDPVLEFCVRTDG